MARPPARRQVGVRWAPLALAVTALVLAPFAVAADRRAGMVAGEVALDVSLGLALAVSGPLGRPRRQGALVSLIGVSWLLGSILPQAATLSRGALLLALVAFPTGLVRARWGWWPYAAAVVVALPGCPQLVVGLLFLGVAGLLAIRRPVPRSQPVAAALASFAGLTQLLSGAALAGGVVELLPLLSNGYELALGAVALGFPWAARTASRRLVDAATGPTPHLADPLDRLAQLLGGALGDRTLGVQLVEPAVEEPVPNNGPRPRDRPQRSGSERELVVLEGTRTVAVVTSTTAALDDPATARVVAESVRLVVVNSRLAAEEHQRVADVTQSRARLVEAEDQERYALRAVLSDRVSAPLGDLVSDLETALVALSDPQSRGAVELALTELRGSVEDTESMLAGTPPTQLGDGRLAEALDDLRRRCPVPMAVSVAPAVAGDQAAETALYAACSEAVSNALKHAEATLLTCHVRRDGGDLVATVTDNGIGGADPSGSGLVGIGDRLAARGGRLRVESAPGAGTTVEARTPTRAQSIF